MFCAEALFVIFTALKGAAKGSARMQGITRKILKNHIFFRLQPLPFSGKENAESVSEF
jgi:hypothetical protein